MRAVAPCQIVVDKNARSATPLNPSIVQPSDRREWICPDAFKHDGKRGERLREIARTEQTLVPGKRRIEIIHKVLRKNVRVSCRKRIQRLRRNSVKQRIDRIRVRGLHASVGLQTKPRRVLLVDVVIEASRLHLLVVVARLRNTLLIRAAVPVRRSTLRHRAARIERTAEHRHGRPARVAIQRKHFLIKRHQRRLRRIARSRRAAGGFPQRKLLQHIVLKCGGRNRDRRHDRQRDAHPLAIEKEK